MRAVALVLLFAAAGLAAGDDEATVRALVEQLASDSGARRRAARERLARMGDTIVPLLQRIPADDPDVRRALRELTRSARKVRLRLPNPPATQRLGQPLVLAIEVVNETEDTWVLPLTRAVGRVGRTFSSFGLRAGADGEGGAAFLTPDQVEPAADVPNPAVLLPGQKLRFTIRLEGAASSLRRPGRGELTVFFDHPTALFWFGRPANREERSANAQRLILETDPVVVEAKGSTPAALEAALRGGDAKERLAALAEIGLRDDDDLLPVLRRHAGDKDLRLTSVQRLGEAAAEEDFRLVYDAARDPNADVRKAAVLALGNYPGRKARARLIGLVQAHDFELTPFAVTALRKHKHPVTIDCFIVVMRQGDERLVREIADVLWDWTGKPLSNRRDEIERFAAWWVTNRAAWARANLPRR